MHRILLFAIALFVAGCVNRVDDNGALAGKTVTLDGNWNGLSKTEAQLICDASPKLVDVADIGDRAIPQQDEKIRVTTTLRWRGTTPQQGKKTEERPVQLTPAGYYIDWADAKWEKLEGTPNHPLFAIQSYKDGLAGIHAANPAVKIRIDRDAAHADEPVLVDDYPAETKDPVARDVWCESENSNWTTGRAVSVQVKSLHAERLSISFLDRNGVAYTDWIEVKPGAWQSIRIAFDKLRPNPYYQPPGAKLGAPIDVSNIAGIAFAPHGHKPGELMLTKFVVTE